MEVILRGGLNWNFDKIGTEVRDDVIGGKIRWGKIEIFKIEIGIKLKLGSDCN